MNTHASPRTLGIIGFGNMGRSLAAGVRQNPGLAAAFPLLVYEANAATARSAEEAGFPLATGPEALAAGADIILLAVKPDQVGAVLRDIEAALSPDKLLLSIAAGISMDFLSAGISNRCPVARAMPNTPALVGQGIFGLSMGPTVPAPLQESLRALFNGLGATVEIAESKMHAFTGFSGSGPGYVFHFLESLAEAGVTVGLDRENSRRIALGLLRGCAALAEQSGLHPAVLREQVSSPGGTTIAGLNVFDRNGVRGHIIDAVLAATGRSREMEEAAKKQGK